MKLYLYRSRAAAAYAGVVWQENHTKAASIPNIVRTRMNGDRPREIGNWRTTEGRASDSGRLVTLVRRLNPRCNRDGKAFRERDGLRLKAGAWFTHVGSA